MAPGPGASSGRLPPQHRPRSRAKKTHQAAPVTRQTSGRLPGRSPPGRPFRPVGQGPRPREVTGWDTGQETWRGAWAALQVPPRGSQRAQAQGSPVQLPALYGWSRRPGLRVCRPLLWWARRGRPASAPPGRWRERPGPVPECQGRGGRQRPQSDLSRAAGQGCVLGETGPRLTALVTGNNSPISLKKKP